MAMIVDGTPMLENTVANKSVAGRSMENSSGI
jgi:hypothetical protein